jgi:hypothetical protein
MRGFGFVAFGPVAMAAMAVLAMGGASLVAPALRGGSAGLITPVSENGSPIAGSPQAELPPLYTPIPVSEARNVVGRVTIKLTDRGFIPSRFEDAINQEIDVTLVNTGARPHTFTIDELGIAVAVASGETTQLTIPSSRRLGHYTYYSDTPIDRELGMSGIMTIFI